jgi:hypothetical protein
MKCLESPIENPSRRVRYDRSEKTGIVAKWRKAPNTLDRTVPYGTDHVLPIYQAFHARLPSCSPYGTVTSNSLDLNICQRYSLG